MPLSLQRHNMSYDYATECGEHAFIDTTPLVVDPTSGTLFSSNQSSFPWIVYFFSSLKYRGAV